MLDDCGEWGGPHEEFKLYGNSTTTFKLDYKKFRFNCDSIEYYYSSDKLLDYKKSILLSAHHKKAMAAFFADVMKTKINEKTRSNAGSIYSLKATDSSLNMRVYTTQKEIKKKYIAFRKKLNLEKRSFN